MNSIDKADRIIEELRDGVKDLAQTEWGRMISAVIAQDQPNADTLAHVLVRLQPPATFAEGFLPIVPQHLAIYLELAIARDQITASRKVARSATFLALVTLLFALVQTWPIIRSWLH
jgi:hypothetical protein